MRDGVKPLVFKEDGHTIEVGYSNRGEPYRDGVQILFTNDEYRQPATLVLLDSSEVRSLRDKLTEYLGEAAGTASEAAASPERFGQYDHLESATPVYSWISLDTVCNVAVKANYGAVRLATALVRAIEKRDAEDGRLKSTLGTGLRRVIECGAF